MDERLFPGLSCFSPKVFKQMCVHLVAGLNSILYREILMKKSYFVPK